MIDVIAATYFGVGIWLAILMRDEFVTDKEWFAAAPIVVLAWFPGVVALGVVKVWYAVRRQGRKG